MKHPNSEELALFAGGDAGWWTAITTRRHTGLCVRCREEVEALRLATAELRAGAGRLPAGLNWDRLAAEMKANIRVGLAAAECVAPAPAPVERMSWRMAALLASATAIVLTGFFLNMPRPVAPKPVVAETQFGVVLRATPAGIQMQENGRAVTLLNPEAKVITVSGEGAMGARYVDEETGQITITQLYVQ